MYIGDAAFLWVYAVPESCAQFSLINSTTTYHNVINTDIYVMVKHVRPRITDPW